MSYEEKRFLALLYWVQINTGGYMRPYHIARHDKLQPQTNMDINKVLRGWRKRGWYSWGGNRIEMGLLTEEGKRQGRHLFNTMELDEIESPKPDSKGLKMGMLISVVVIFVLLLIYMAFNLGRAIGWF